MADVKVSRKGRKAVFVVDHKDLKPLKDFDGIFIWVDENGEPELVVLVEEQPEA